MSGDPIYTEMIIEYSRNPSNYGKLENPQITRHDSNPLCGDSIDLYLNINDNKISDVKFDGKGCAICMACSSVLTEMIKGKDLSDVKKFQKDELEHHDIGLQHDAENTLGYNILTKIITKGCKAAIILSKKIQSGDDGSQDKCSHPSDIIISRILQYTPNTNH